MSQTPMMRGAVNLPTTTNPTIRPQPISGDPLRFMHNLPALYTGVTPDQISGLKMWLDARSGVINGSSGPASDGDAVANWVNKASGGATATQSTTANRPTFRNVSGTRYIHLDSSTHPQNMALAGLTGLHTDAATVFLVVRATSTTQQEYVMALGVAGSQVALQTSGSGQNYLLSSPTGGPTPTQPVTGGFDILGFYADSSVTPSTTKGTFMSEGANTHFQLINGNNAAFTSYDASTSYLGATSAGTFTWDGDFQAVLIFNRILTTTEMLQMQQYLYNTYVGGSLAARTVTIKNFGDSIGAGFGTIKGDFLAHVQQSYSNVAKTNVLNFAVPASTTDTCVSSGVLAIGLAMPTIGTVVGSIFWGANDLDTPGNVSHFEGNISAMCASMRAAGITKIGVSTVIDRNDSGVSGSFRTDAATFNTWLRANYTTFADVLIDYAANTNLGSVGAADNTTYFQDKVHPTDLGHAIMATIWRNAMFPIVADRLIFTTQPDAALSGSIFGTQPVVAAQDGYGDTDTTVSGTVTISKLSGPGALSGTLSETMTAGVATFTDLQVSAPGPYVFQITKSGLTAGNSSTLTVMQVLIGSAAIQSALDYVGTGQVIGWQFPALATGTTATAWLATYSTLPTSVAIGIYSDSGGHPNTLLGSGTFTSMVTGWNSTALTGVSLVSGASYWLVVTPTGARINIYNQYPSGSLPQEANSGTTLPSSWSPTSSIPNVAPTSIYITG